jgi:integrase
LQKNRKPDEAYVLTGMIRKFMEPRLLQSHFKKILSTLEIEHANFHTLRHTFATRCVELGFDIKSLSEILGHSTVNITLNRYVHPSMDLKQRNMNMLSDLFTVS